jgi:hypothetical protein
MSWAAHSPALSTSHSGFTSSHPTPTLPATALPSAAPMPRGVRSEESMHDADYAPDAALGLDAPVTAVQAPRGKAVKRDDNGTPAPAPDVSITVHFPVARIKRIMQADDDVGKVAQVTPVVVCECCSSPATRLPRRAALVHR